ncbi:hypothetical protein SAMN05216347_102288 [Streptococcus equinus]|uniref:Uncharacterized protein n=1 Tax=Streptococcus equinus TaxID=1335 RepID=A0A1H0MCI8_STREI|nr:hypothetical protein [Streptococcus equinus]SDO78139.1 hypothetical protein SAMN05216347_102288 [Streptococcus equinus]
MTQYKHIRIVQAGHFLKLFKNDSQFATPIFRIDQKRKNLQFVIVFKLEDDGFYILNHSKLGYSSDIKRIRLFTKSMLYQGMMSVPLRARETIQILQVPSSQDSQKDYITYYNQAAIAWIAYGKKIDDVYDPFRDAHSAIFHNEWQEEQLLSYEDYQGIQDFHPFSVKEDQENPLSCFYKDPIRKQNINLQVMGWYYLGQQLKISWKPDNQYKARWRSSVVAIDKKTGKYFFQGNIYRQKGTDPVFLDHLLIDFEGAGQNSRAAKAEYHQFIDEIKEQERVALLKLR